MRRKIVAGNWKMNKTPAEAAAFARELAQFVGKSETEAVLCVPFVDIPAVVEAVRGTEISVGAQNLHFEDSGAFTGEVSAAMLVDLGVKYVIIGHSERREYFGETNEIVNKKTLKALEAGLLPIVCVGERLHERERGITVELVRLQVKTALYTVPREAAERIVIAYEPIWAIGTGVTATNAQAQEVCGAIRAVLTEMYGGETAAKIRLQYGGSVNTGNARELFSMPDIDGGLVGGASLKLDFVKIINY